MRRDVSELKSFYGSPLGQAARDTILRQLVQAWGSLRMYDVLGVGYATPYLAPFRQEARRTVAAMPAAQGVELWPRGERVLSCLTADAQLPFPNALFDRVLMIHALEEAEDPLAMMREATRVLAPSGRLIVVAAARGGLWAHAEHTPFGHGRPFTRGQLEQVVAAAGLEPAAWSRALYAPPYRGFAAWADAIEQIGSRLAAPASGVVMMEAVKQTLAVRPKGALAPAARRPMFQPAPVGAVRTRDDFLNRQGRRTSS